MSEKHSGFVYKPTPKKAWSVGSKRASARFGATPLMPTGHGWMDYRSIPELQDKNGIESYACSVYAALKAWLMLAVYHRFPLPANWSERFNAIVAGIKPPGAVPFEVGESIRTTGVIIESLLPFDDSIKTLNEYYSPNPMDSALIGVAKKTVEQYEFGHEPIFNDEPGTSTPTLNKPTLLKSALERGTVCLSVYAWKYDGKYYYKDPGDEDCHWVQLVDYEQGKYWVISDQYEPFIKKVAWFTDFQTAELYFLQVNSTGIAPNDRSYFLNILRKMVETLKAMLLQLKSRT